MSGTMNSAVIVGRVGRDPETRHTQKGDKVVSFSVATDRWKKGDPTDWHNVTCFGKTADFVAEYVRKGDSVAVRGSIRYEEWTDKDGAKKKTTKINADAVELVGGKRRDDGQDTAGEPAAPFVADDSDVPFGVMLAPLAGALLGFLA